MNELTPEEQENIIEASQIYDTKSPDKAIAIGLTQGDGWWGNVLATDHYVSQRNDLAADFHDFCALNSLDRCDIKAAEYFLKELKAQQMLDEIKDDFK